jgi:hypothetical protein
MSQSATASLAFAPPVPLPVEADFLGERLTSDGGLVWLEEADRALGLSAALAAALPDWRRRPGRHPLLALVRQRVYQLACGYEDQADAAALRADPLLKLVCGRLPAGDPDLASQPTLSRLENAPSATACYRLALALGEVYLRERERDGAPERVVLDLDGTDDPAHGAQEGAAYHGYYRQHQYFPLLVFDGETGQLVTAVLRPGTVHAGHGAVAVLKQVVKRVRARWPGVAVEVRGDSGFARPDVYAFCAAEQVAYTIALVPNPRLERLAAPLLAAAERRQAAGDGAKVRLIGEAAYRAESWPEERRVVIKAELLPKGPNTRFVVTTRAEAADRVYGWYVDRGEAENWIKDLKNACFADRLSCHRFLANQVRLLLSAAAYWLLDTLRRWLVRLGAARTQLDTLRLHLIKLGGFVRQGLDRVRLRLSASHPGEPLWLLLAARPDRLVNNPG